MSSSIVFVRTKIFNADKLLTRSLARDENNNIYFTGAILNIANNLNQGLLDGYFNDSNPFVGKIDEGRTQIWLKELDTLSVENGA